jgi:hypothetical protein
VQQGESLRPTASLTAVPFSPAATLRRCRCCWLLALQSQTLPPAPPLQVLLVGGFAASPYLLRRVKEELGTRMQVVVPDEPAAAVVVGEALRSQILRPQCAGHLACCARVRPTPSTGAMLYGRDPSRIAVRRARRGYGIRMYDMWSEEHAVYQACHPQALPKKEWLQDSHGFFARGWCSCVCCTSVPQRLLFRVHVIGDGYSQRLIPACCDVQGTATTSMSSRERRWIAGTS